MHRAFPKNRFTKLVTQTIRVLVCVIVLYVSALGALKITGYQFASVVSDSMAPLFRAGDLIIVKKEPFAVGDVVMFARGDSLVMHRLVEHPSEDTWRTRGDANASDDPWTISGEDIRGVVVASIRGFGKPLMWLQRRGARAAFSTQISRIESAYSTYYANSNISWTSSVTSTYFSAHLPNYVTLTGYGDRKFWASNKSSAPLHVQFNGKLSQVDLNQPGLNFVVHGCVTADVVSCGFYVSFDDKSKVVRLRTFTAAGVLSPDIASAATSVLTSVTSHIAIHRLSDGLVVMQNGKVLLKIANLSSKLTSLGLSIPTGNNNGMWITGNNQITNARINFWQ
jgi:signal peptidase I